MHVKKIFIILSLLLVALLATNTAYAQELPETQKYKARVVEIIESTATNQLLKVKLATGEEITIDNNLELSAKNITYSQGDTVIVESISIGNAKPMYIITDFYRANSLTIIFIGFVILSIVVGKKYGVYSLLGMAFSFLMIFKFILPNIIKGSNPIIITVIAALLIVPVTFYLSHGFSRKTHIAIASTLLTLIITTILTGVSVNAAKLTGYSSEEAMFLQVANESINMKGILLAGIIIGFLGVLDDVTVSQASVVTQLRKTRRHYTTQELYKDAMEVGRDHITSMINTLVLVYAGASMPLLLLFVNNPQPFGDIVNMEIVADEVVRTLVGSIGLILAVPLSTYISALLNENSVQEIT